VLAGWLTDPGVASTNLPGETAEKADTAELAETTGVADTPALVVATLESRVGLALNTADSAGAVERIAVGDAAEISVACRAAVKTLFDTTNAFFETRLVLLGGVAGAAPGAGVVVGGAGGEFTGRTDFK
jgi:hypothetical protein